MPVEFENLILEYCQDNALISPGSRILLAVSGGADSVALLHAFKSLKDQGQIGCGLAAAHINHNLRGGDSDGDEQFVSRLAGEFDIAFVTRSVDVCGYGETHNLSIETTARILRMESLIDIAAEFGCAVIATAHHADDNAETLMHRLQRGTGLRGLCGIEPVKRLHSNARSAVFIRPMLSVGRDDVMAYCSGKDIQWRCDHTNDQLCYTRNRIRHVLLPHIQSHCSEPLEPKLNKLATACRKLYKRISAVIDGNRGDIFTGDDGGAVRIAGDVFGRASEIVQVEILRRGLEMIGCGLRDINQTHYRQMISLAAGAGGRTIQLPGRFAAKSRHGDIVLDTYSDSESGSDNEQDRLEIGVDAEVVFNGYKIAAKCLSADDCDLDAFTAEKNPNVEWFDLDKLKLPLCVRKRLRGDRFVPFGSNGEQKVGKFITKNRISYDVRDRMMVFEDAEKIFWLGLVRPSEETKVDSGTRRILEITVG